MKEASRSLNFIEHIIEDDLKTGYGKDQLRFRFPPEPNGYLHVGHASSICLNFGLGLRYNAPVNLRFDDTNPTKEEQEYVDAIKRDVSWLGFEWDNLFHASDYFEQLYDFAVHLIKTGKAYVEELGAEEIIEYRGDWMNNQPDRNSPWRDRPVEENLDLFERMKWLTKDPVVEDSNADSGTDFIVDNATITGQAQSFAVGANAMFVTKVAVNLKKTGSPTGNVVASIYSHSGTYGSSSTPNALVGTASANVSAANLTTGYEQVTFNFPTPVPGSVTTRSPSVIAPSWRWRSISMASASAFDW